jgi:hypothetical protein
MSFSKKQTMIATALKFPYPANWKELNAYINFQNWTSTSLDGH